MASLALLLLRRQQQLHQPQLVVSRFALRRLSKSTTPTPTTTTTTLLRRLPPATAAAGRRLLRSPVRALHGSAPRRFVGDQAAWSKSRSPEQHHQHHQQQQMMMMTELDKADALMLRKSHETGFLSWFRNGLLATGIGVIAFVQSDVGREAGYAFFILGGMCVSFGGATYVLSLFSLRRMMLLSLPAVLLQGAVVSSAALFWLCAVSLYIGRLEVEIIHDDEDEEMEEEDSGDEGCRECRERRQDRGYRGPHDNRRHGGVGGEDGHNKGQDK